MQSAKTIRGLSVNGTLRFVFFYILLSIGLSASLSGQGDSHVSKLELRRQVESEIGAHEASVLPLQRLDTLRIASLTIGSADGIVFKDRLDDYTEVQHFRSTKDLAGNDFNLLIIGLFDTASAQEIEALEELPCHSLLVLFVDSISVNLQNTDAVIRTKPGSIYQDYAAQMIFGGIGQEGSRFKYTIPEEVGVDGVILEQRIDSVMQLGLDSMAFPGGQILIAKDRKVIFRKSYGFHTYDQTKPVTDDDIYDLASITKVTGATLGLMKIHDHGGLDLDQTLGGYFPLLKNSNKSNISLRSVLAHNARLKSWIPYYETVRKPNGRYRQKTLSTDSTKTFDHRLSDNLFLHEDYQVKIQKMIRKSPLNERPGYVYSGLIFYLIPDLITGKTGTLYPQYLQEQFYQRLGATTLTYNPTNRFALERIVPTEEDTYFRNRLLHGVVHDEGAAMMRGISGNAGLFANANDLAKVWQMLLDFGQYGRERYLSYQTVRKFTACQYCEQGNRRGLGFDKPMIEYDPIASSSARDVSPDTFGHSGYTGTLVWADPAENLLFIFLSNRVHPSRENRKIYDLNIRPAIHNIIYDLLPD